MTPYEKKNLSYRFASLLVNRPKSAIVLGLLLAAVFIPGITRLSSDFGYRIWFRIDDPLLREFDAFERRFGNDEMIAVVVYSPSGIFDSESVQVLQGLTKDMWQVDEIIRVESLANYNWVHAEGDDLFIDPLLAEDQALSPSLLEARKRIALEHEVIPGYLVGKDGTAAVVFAQLKPAIGNTPDFEQVMLGTREKVKKYTGLGDHRFFITGSAAVSHTFKEVTQSDLETMVPILLGAIVLFLLFSFRSVSGVVLPFVVIVLSLTMTLGFAGWLNLKFNNLTATVPHILIAISIADAVHILVTFIQFRRAGLLAREAAHKTLVKNLMPTLMTSISTSIGFFSFATAALVPIIHMGILAGVGTLFAWLITILIITPLLSFLPIRVAKANAVHSISEPHPMALRYARWVQRHRIGIIAFSLITGASAIFIGLQNEVNSDPFKYFAPGVATRVANDFTEAHVGGASGMEIVIDSGRPDGIKDPAFLRKVDEFQQWLNGREYVTKTVSIVDIVKQTNRSLHGDDPAAYIIPDDQESIAQELFLYTMSLPQGMDINNRMTLDNDMLRITAMWTLHESKRSLTEIEIIEAKAAEMGLSASITGKMPLYQGMNGYVVQSFIRSITMAVIMMALLMVVVFRSWKLGLLSMVPNTIPLMFGAAIMTILGKPLDVGTVLVTSTCLGIAVDDTVHFLANYNRWRRAGADRAYSIAQVLTFTGPALMVTTLILVVAFGTFAFASFVPNINFGILTAIVLTTALFADFTLLPALILSGKQRTFEMPEQAAATAVSA